ncbi:MAG: recombinase family protein [Hespellia sp.]|nr:recombinase family protein [Hespellia sp.]
MGTIYGYCRASGRRQSIDRQKQKILAACPSAVVIQDVTIAKLGDRMIFDSVSHMGDTADDCFLLYEKLFNLGVELSFLKEPYLDTSVYRNAMYGHANRIGVVPDSILKGITEYMTNLVREQIQITFDQRALYASTLRQRTREGIASARTQGRQIGQPAGAKLTTKKSIQAKDVIVTHNKSFGGELNDQDTWQLAGISKMTFYKYKKELLHPQI